MSSEGTFPGTDLKADPPPARLGTHVVFTVDAKAANGQQETLVCLVYKDTLHTPRWGLPGGTWGEFDHESPVHAAARLVRVRLDSDAGVSPVVIGVDWVPRDRYAPGVNVVLDGGELTDVAANLMRPTPGSGYGEVRFVAVDKLDTVVIDQHSKRRIVAALEARKAGRGFPMTQLGVPLPDVVRSA
ncbi:hypothetical protein [Kitasatospora phosalacinea]|uniref:Nudix hydrolase domain-containing protein n=1 Tax=Kitasatospora phosalacinea TaxID=2065 RepID=A0A9W6PFL9_9ACTN|nr:hypothetical protein [Kitasatospora phosalacinea]GLW53986.1 hypothetical protein Kpho01_19970 [Kitasatospora phosalacinea]